MLRQLGRRAAPAALLSAIFALAACSSSGMNATPSASGMAPVTGAQHIQASRLTILGIHPDGCSKKKFIACFTASLSGGGATIDWCYGPPSSPCADTNTVTWSGNVCMTRTPSPCAAIRKMIGTWTGPFACAPSTCGTGSYEVDTITFGKKQPAITNGKYKYKQDIILSGSLGGDIGLAVGQ